MKAIGQPFEYENYRKQKIKEKIEQEAATRIDVKQKAPKVNARVAARLVAEKNTALIEDERFGKKLFENPDFAVDEENEKYKLYHQTTKKVWNHFIRI